MIKFQKHYVQNTENDKKCRVWYSFGKHHSTGKDCVWIYAKGYGDSLRGILDFNNGTDTMTDYFEKDHACIFPENEHFEAARKRALNIA